MRHLVYVAPDDIRARFQGLNVHHLTRQAAAMRPRPGHQVDYVTLFTLRELGRRAVGLEDEIDRLDDAARTDRHRPRPGPVEPATAAAPSSPRPCRSPPATDPNGSAPKRRGRTCAAPRRSPPSSGKTNGRLPAQPRREPPSQLGAAPHRADPHGPATNPPRPTSTAAATKAEAPSRSCAPSSATSPAKPSSTSPDRDL